jgi:hypothetical protein
MNFPAPFNFGKEYAVTARSLLLFQLQPEEQSKQERKPKA